jgi:hypothetical protein
MLTNSKMALSLALVLATALAASAALNQSVPRGNPAVQQQFPAGAHMNLESALDGFGAVNRFGG